MAGTERVRICKLEVLVAPVTSSEDQPDLLESCIDAGTCEEGNSVMQDQLIVHCEL